MSSNNTDTHWIYIVMAYTVMAYAVMAYVVMAFIFMAIGPVPHTI